MNYISGQLCSGKIQLSIFFYQQQLQLSYFDQELSLKISTVTIFTNLIFRSTVKMQKFIFDVDDMAQTQNRSCWQSVIKSKKDKSKRNKSVENIQKSNTSKILDSQQNEKRLIKQSDSQCKKSVRPKRQKHKFEPYIPNSQLRLELQLKRLESVKCGHAKFIKYGITSPVQSYSINARQTLKNKVTWWISNGQYSKSNWSRIFRDMYEVSVRKLDISSNQYPNIIKQIHHVRLDSLQILYLQENNITSIELLSRMCIPQLKDLNLSNNKITSLRSMFRMSLRNLVTFSVVDNYILRMDRFHYVNTVSLEELFLQQRLQQRVIVQDISWIAKLKKSPKLTRCMLHVKDISLIKQQNRSEGSRCGTDKQVSKAIPNKTQTQMISQIIY